jgi:hypothetical protein
MHCTCMGVAYLPGTMVPEAFLRYHPPISIGTTHTLTPVDADEIGRFHYEATLISLPKRTAAFGHIQHPPIRLDLGAERSFFQRSKWIQRSQDTEGLPCRSTTRSSFRFLPWYRLLGSCLCHRLAAEAGRLRKSRPLSGIAWRHHRIITSQFPFGAVLLRCQPVMRFNSGKSPLLVGRGDRPLLQPPV